MTLRYSTVVEERLVDIGKDKRAAREEVRLHGDTLGRISKLDTTRYRKKEFNQIRKIP
jgi:hypothetical protein